MNRFLENAQRLFDVARVAAGHPEEGVHEFALAIRPDGGMHFIMETPFSLEGVASYAGAESVWRVSRSSNGVVIEGKSAATEVCLREKRGSGPGFLRDVALRDVPRYRITSPLLTSSTASS